MSKMNDAGFIFREVKYRSANDVAICREFFSAAADNLLRYGEIARELVGT